MSIKYFARHAILLGFVVSLLACEAEKKNVEEHIPYVKYEVATPSTASEQRSFSGVVQSNVSSSLSFRVPGKVSSVLVDRGDLVKKGQLLAELDAEDHKRSLAKAEADRASRMAEHAEQQRVVKRNVELLRAGTISRVQADTDQTRLKATASGLQIAELNVDNSRRDLENTQLIAPFDGVVISRDIEPFQEVGGGKQAFMLNSPTSLQVKVLVPETLIRHVFYGQDVEVGFPTLPGLSIAGTVSQIGGEVEVGNAFSVLVTLAATDLDLRIGMSASTNFVLRKREDSAFLLPMSAFMRGDLKELGNADEIGHELFVIDPDKGVLLGRKVTLGGVVGSRVRVIEGLEPGDLYAVAGVAFLREGMRVRLWEPAR